MDFHPSAGGSRPMTSPPKRLSIFSIDGDFRLSSRAELAFFRERSRGINAKRFLPSRAFSGTSLRVDPSTRSLRLAPRSLGRDDKKRRRENRQSPQGGELNTSGAEKAERANESARCESKTKEASLSEVRKDCSQRNRVFRTLIGKQPTPDLEDTARWISAASALRELAVAVRISSTAC